MVQVLDVSINKLLKDLIKEEQEAIITSILKTGKKKSII